MGDNNWVFSQVFLDVLLESLYDHQCRSTFCKRGTQSNLHHTAPWDNAFSFVHSSINLFAVKKMVCFLHDQDHTRGNVMGHLEIGIRTEKVDQN